MEYNLTNMGDRIKYVRKEIAKLGQVPFAKSLGITQQAVSQWENGDTAETRHINKIAVKYSINIEWLLTGTGQIPSETEYTQDDGGKAHYHLSEAIDELKKDVTDRGQMIAEQLELLQKQLRGQK